MAIASLDEVRKQFIESAEAAEKATRQLTGMLSQTRVLECEDRSPRLQLSNTAQHAMTQVAQTSSGIDRRGYYARNCLSGDAFDSLKRKASTSCELKAVRWKVPEAKGDMNYLAGCLR